MRRVHPSKRRFLRDYQPPPPTPEGHVYVTSGPGIVRAERLQRECARRMGNYDDCNAETRKLLQTGEGRR